MQFRNITELFIVHYSGRVMRTRQGNAKRRMNLEQLKQRNQRTPLSQYSFSLTGLIMELDIQRNHYDPTSDTNIASPPRREAKHR